MSTTSDPEPHLGEAKYNSVYDQSTKELYNSWAADGYDEMIAQQSVAVENLVQLFLSRAPKKTKLSVLDAGCGTGRVAEVCAREVALREDIDSITYDGIDYSDGMLDVARAKQIYTRLLVADLKQKLPLTDFPNEQYDAMLCSGVFLQGHVGAEAIPELSRVVKSGGLLCFTVRPTFYEETKEEWIATLNESGVDIVSTDMLVYANKDGFKAPFLTCQKR